MSTPSDHTTTADQTRVGPCARTFDWLIEGRDPDEDGEVAGHLASCLACFRVRTDLADVLELSARLRRLESSAADSLGASAPGTPSPAADAFWDALPAQVASEVLASKLPPTAGLAAGFAPARVAPDGGQRQRTASARRWWRPGLGLPGLGSAAAVGMTAAAVAWLLFARPSAQPRTGGMKSSVTSGAAAADEEDDTPDRAEAETAFEQIAALDEPALRQLAQALARSEL